MSALDFVVPHHAKSKSTLLLNKELAVAPAPTITSNLALQYADKLVDTGRRTLGSTLVDQGMFATCNADKNFSDSLNSKDIVANSDSKHSDLGSDYTAAKLKQFNSTLSHIANTNIYVIQSPRQLVKLLDMHYLDSNPLAPASDMFPYLHGLLNITQRVYFHPKFDVKTDLGLLSGDAASLPNRFPYNTDVSVPGKGFHLMTVNTLECARPKLINSISVDSLLTFKTSYVHMEQDSLTEFEKFDVGTFEKFDAVYQLQDLSEADIVNRNYEQQIRLMAPVSHFLVYNNSMNFYANAEAARAIHHLMRPLQRNVYVVNFDESKWLQVSSYIDRDMGMPCERLPYVEQDLIWQLNGIKELFPRFYIGNIYNFKQVTSGRSPYDFKLHIYCHEDAHLPSLEWLCHTFDLLEAGLDEPIHIEFPNTINHHETLFLPRDTLCLLNTLKLINVVVNRFKKKAFAYLFDGFSGITLLLLALGMFWGADSLEDVVCSVFRKPAFRFDVALSDFSFLKNLEVYVQWFKRHPGKDLEVVTELPLAQINANFCPDTKYVDWFHPGTDVNFPCQIYDNLYLGSAVHASSVTVTLTLQISKFVSIDEKPEWFKYLKCTFEHEATSTTQGPIVKPIYTFNNGTAQVYEIVVNSAVKHKLFDSNAPIPPVKSIIYIHNVHDDGKDSLLPLLVGCPDSVQRKILADPRDRLRTLVHCRIGVSRSASLAIASVMKYLCMDMVEAYMYVRVRRFNVIIQPNLRIFYELFLFDDMLRRARHGSLSKRKHCWWVVCDQIHHLNQRYMR